MPPHKFGVHDIVAGLSVAVILIPQSMAYATVAGLPPIHGLYAGAVPPLIAAFFASSPYLQTGPVAMTSLLTFGALSALATPQTGEYVALAALLALAVGVVRVAFGMARAGWVAYLMSQPVLVGFTSAAAILIISSQIPTTLGVQSEGSRLLTRAWWAVSHAGAWELSSVLLAVITLVLVLGGKRIHALFPGVLLAVVFGLVFSVVSGYQGPVIGDVPSGLPSISLDLPWSSVPTLIVPGIVIALVGFAEPSAIARTFAARDRDPWDPHREFVSQGAANLASGIVGGFPVGGSFSRTSINRLSGGKSKWSGAVTGVGVLLFLPFANVVSGLPMAILGAIVIAAVYNLVQLRPLWQLRRFSRPQAAVSWSTFVATLALSPRIDLAVVLGIGLAVLVHLWRELRMEVHAELTGTTLRLEPMGVLFFGSAPGLDRALIGELAAHPDATHLVIDLRKLGRVDYTGAVALKSVAAEAVQAGLTVEMVGVPPHAQRVIGKVVGKPEVAPPS